ncbi:rRNA maturation RNase YbeY [Octadecabacter sp. R77987]|uniref:rRNA maturation RNase YbeY n=1 Tax=Octadecabacter sp. R77987 TaxID=3093874 RepID=UPI00367254A7
MSVDVIIEDKRWQAAGLEGLAETAVGATFAELGVPDACDVSLMGCNDTRIADLNADFRGKPVPTNVLSWPSEERGADRDGGQPRPPRDPELGDIAIAFETCQREAAEAGRTMAAHCTHLIVHGTLHLLGYDHERDADATLMEGLETQILGKLGIADPYRIT